MSRRSMVVGVLIVAILVVAAMLLPELRTALAFLAVVLVPGLLAATVVLGVGEPSRAFPPTALLLGISVVILGGMLASATPFGLSGWFVLALVAIACVVALYVRRNALPALARAIATPRIGRAPMALMLAAAIIVAGSVAVAVATEEPSRTSSLWQLWMIERDATTIDIGAAVVAGPSGSAAIELWADDELVTRWEGVRLAAGAEWHEELAKADVPAGTGRLRLVLTAEGDVMREAMLNLGDAQ